MTAGFVYTPGEAWLRSELTDQAFAVCNREGVDVYAVMGRVIVEGTEREGMFE